MSEAKAGDQQAGDQQAAQQAAQQPPAAVEASPEGAAGPSGPSVPLSVHVIDRVNDQTRRLENEWRSQERRRNPRFALQVASYLQIDGFAGQSAAHVGDISIGGLFVRVDLRDVTKGVRVRLVLELPFFAGHRICTLTGRVVRVVPAADSLGLSVEFDEGQTHDQGLLNDFLTLWATPGDALKSR